MASKQTNPKNRRVLSVSGRTGSPVFTFVVQFTFIVSFTFVVSFGGTLTLNRSKLARVAHSLA
jgi:hypothetical protein